jgi:two-component system OmpR family response regulator
MRILVIEDNKALATALRHRFNDQGHAATVVFDGLSGRQFLLQEDFDLVILDINLPGASGLDLLAEARRIDVSAPVLLLTARDSVADRVTGLDSGADDYLVKPFEMDELDARVRALLRRKPSPQESSETIGALTIHRHGRWVSANGTDLALARKEFAALECLMDRRGGLVTKSQLIDHIYGIGEDASEGNVEVLISRLRKKLMPHDIEIRVARGLGYHIKAPE